MKTLAIVIGNDSYHANAELSYAVKDAQGIADVFNRLGYDVMHISNCTSAQCSDILETLETKIPYYDATIVFFAGHGFQYEGENYLTSVDCQIPPSSKYSCNQNSITLTDLLNIFKKHPDKINIVIIDACRKGFDRGSSSTFAPVQAPKGTLIAFSTSPEEGAKDGGFEGHSIYTGALLSYIGRERLSVEELFKKVRRTVYNLSKGKQTPWEHTSLIGDFYFNVGQLVHSIQIPYSDEVVKDANYEGKADDFTARIFEARSCDWNRQNPAFNKLLSYGSKSLDKNQQFILGRNLLQAGAYAFTAGNFFEQLAHNLQWYTENGENHILNGILFEIYFDSRGEFRNNNIKMQCFEEVMTLRKNIAFRKSFDFIAGLLKPHLEERLLWIPGSNDDVIDVDVLVDTVNGKNWKNEAIQYDIIDSIKVMGADITDNMRSYNLYQKGHNALKQSIANYLVAPENLIQINCNKVIKNITFASKNDDDLPSF